jgi:pimeloyl-ACP methyl ester carboxylesterase
MARFVLVHGSFHGNWCWQRLIPLLEARGHEVVAPNLPASGDDPAPPSEADLPHYVARIGEAIDALESPVILVGHSMGGVVSAQVSEHFAPKLAATVYVNGLLFRSGESLAGFLDEHAHLGVRDLVIEHMQVQPDGVTAIFPPEHAPHVFYNTCSSEDAAYAASRLTPQRRQVYLDPLVLTPDGFGTVRRFYVEGTLDNAVPLPFQRAMTSRTPCEEVFTLECDHSPFLSYPEKLADILDGIARKLS